MRITFDTQVKITKHFEPFTVNVSEEFERFLELMGDKVELKGWQKYRGGLDVKSKFPEPCVVSCMFSANENKDNE